MTRVRRFFTRPALAMLAAVYGAPAALCWTGPVQAAAGWALAGLLEYTVHRWLFHGLERRRPALYDVMHGAHHRLPDDASRRAVPLTTTAPLAFAAAVVLPPGVLAGVFLGYLWFEAAHALCHRRGPLPRALARLRAHHARHHFGQPDRAFGVSTRLWDRLLGTMPTRPHPWAVCGGPDEPRPEALGPPVAPTPLPR